MREWLGFEHLCVTFADDPAWIGEMVEFWTVYVLALLERILAVTTLDHVQVNEDMAYKLHSMISPRMARRFLVPAWRSWIAAVKTRCPHAVVTIDSDGYIGELLPLFIEAGFDGTWPVEVAAGNDLNLFRRAYGSNLAYGGGIDKRALAAGGAVMRAELARVRPVIESGGYIPGCDHGVPADIAWPDFIAYARELARLTGWTH
jgi:uroporphyrinogen decarboxylase